MDGNRSSPRMAPPSNTRPTLDANQRATKQAAYLEVAQRDADAWKNPPNAAAAATTTTPPNNNTTPPATLDHRNMSLAELKAQARAVKDAAYQQRELEDEQAYRNAK